MQIHGKSIRIHKKTAFSFFFQQSPLVNFHKDNDSRQQLLTKMLAGKP
jgi:hypothetical protein